MSDLTPEETLRREADEASAFYHATVVVKLGEALAAVAAERERLGERLLSDEAVHANRRSFEGWNTVSTAGVDSSRRGLSAAWRVVTGSNHE